MNHIILTISCLSLLASNSVLASGGGMEGGGGNARAILVVQQAGLIAQNLKRVPQGVLKNLSPYTLEQTLTHTKVDMGKDLELNGKPVDAINFPNESRIVFSSPSVDRLKGTREFSTLILHEFMGVSRIDDSSYQLSVPIIDYLEHNPPTVSYRGGYDSIECKEFEDGRQTGSGISSAFHGFISGGNGFEWNAYFTSGIYKGNRRLFFTMEATDRTTHQTIARLEIPAENRLEGTLIVPEGKSLYCWVHYSWDR